ncbi:hypothetical protein PDJAM_G00180940 [Pangasius djambal]|uniref:Uncharacterized protein n=1 Tax=Pangasius djambal TaxID=1691987 RepID=A0ACC5Y393_9TELE|nr:hypothetical protein [Pangasius djambal]
MEGNRDEAEKCINIATKALEAGDKEKAIKFLNKAEKLFPTDKAKALLEALLKNGSSAGNGGAYYRKSANGTESTATPPPRQHHESANSDMSKSFTKEQEDDGRGNVFVLIAELRECSVSGE